MPKNIVEDIIVPEKRKSIRDIPIPENRKNKTISSKSKVKVDNVEVPPVAPTMNGRGRNGKNSSPKRRFKWSKRTWISLLVVLVIVLFAVLSIFDGGTLAYTPKSLPITFNHDVYTASKAGDEALLYSVAKLSAEKSVTVPASGEQQVERKASGTIIVYNDASTQAQTLIATTRFEAANGKVYRIKDGIRIPGKKTVSGQSVPGSIEVMVYADEAGETYNQGLTDFTVPGLKGDARYKTIYARSKTEMTGGFIGKAKVVSEENLAKAKADLKLALDAQLMDEARAQAPADFVLIPELSTISYEDLPQTDAGNGDANVGMRSNLNALMFKKTDLSKHLASKKTTLTSEDVVVLEPLESLTFAFFGSAPEDLLSSDQMSFEVTGDSAIVWKTDENALRADLLGRKKGDVQSVLGNYPSIAKADVIIRPFWKRSFPDQISDITVKRVVDK